MKSTRPKRTPRRAHQEMVNAADMDLQQGIERGRQIEEMAPSKQKRRSLIPEGVLRQRSLIPLNASPEQAARQMDLNAAKATASAVGIMSGLTSEVELLSAQNRRNLDMLKMREPNQPVQPTVKKPG